MCVYAQFSCVFPLTTSPAEDRFSPRLVPAFTARAKSSEIWRDTHENPDGDFSQSTFADIRFRRRVRAWRPPSEPSAELPLAATNSVSGSQRSHSCPSAHKSGDGRASNSRYWTGVPGDRHVRARASER